MPEMRPGFVRITRDTGAQALIGVGGMPHILHNVTMKKVGDHKVEVPTLTIHLSATVVIHTEVSEEVFLKALAQAAALGALPVIDTADQV